MPGLYVTNWVSVYLALCAEVAKALPTGVLYGMYLYGSTQRLRGTLCRVRIAAAAGAGVPLKGLGDAVVSSDSPSSHSPQVRCYLWPSILLEVTD